MKISYNEKYYTIKQKYLMLKAGAEIDDHKKKIIKNKIIKNKIEKKLFLLKNRTQLNTIIALKKKTIIFNPVRSKLFMEILKNKIFVK